MEYKVGDEVIVYGRGDQDEVGFIICDVSINDKDVLVKIWNTQHFVKKHQIELKRTFAQRMIDEENMRKALHEDDSNAQEAAAFARGQI